MYFMSESKKISRSNRRFEKAVDSAVARRERLLAKGLLSVVDGRVDIHISSVPDNKNTNLSPEEQIRVFNEEGEQIADGYQSSRVVRHASAVAITDSLIDPETSGIVFIGHGNIGSFWVSGGVFGWQDVASTTTPLKTGVIEQRMCGHFPRRTAALGTFAVSELNLVIAATGEFVDDVAPDSSLFVPVYDASVDLREQIRALNDEHCPLLQA
jgi:hypothetical protein